MSVESPRDMSDPVSPYERPIRPLPKRRLRERLSPDVADTIQYPPVPQAATPLFYHPYTIREDIVPLKVVESQHPSNRERGDEVEPRGYISRRIGEDVESDEDEIAYRSRVYSRHTADTTGRSYRYVQKPDTKHPKPQGPASAASSADGYDSFENTNNKKKRKIPTPGENGVHLANEIGAMGASNVDEPADDTQASVTTYHSPTSAGSHGLSGPGRGRYGRNRSGRSPLRTLSDSSGNWGNSRTTKQRLPQWPTPTESPGIISRSIANANAEKSPIQPARGQENVSLLQQQASKKASPSTQFTFTCDSQVPGTVPWPASTHSTNNQHPPSSRMATQATQTSPNMAGGTHSSSSNGQRLQRNGVSHNASNGQKQSSASHTKKTRRRSGTEYLIAARKRRQEQEDRNFDHPPSPEDVWICEFCEYERIFGTPPVALIRQYEEKDKKIKMQEKERRRLLLKAKSKRKGKKGSKVAPKAAATTHDRQPQPHAQRTARNQSQSQGTQSEEYYDDEYDEDYNQDEPPPPSPVAPIHQQEPIRPDPTTHPVAQGGPVNQGGSGSHPRNGT